GFSYGRKSSESEPSSLDHGWTSYCWLLWEKRGLLYKVAIRVLFAATFMVLLIPSQYESTARIMPPEQGGSGALLSLLAGRAGGGDAGFSGVACFGGDFLGPA